MISSNVISLFPTEHDQNGVCNCNLYSIQDPMRRDEPAGTKFKHVCADFPNLSLLAKRTNTVKIQVTFGHASVGENSFGETATVFDLAGSLESLMVVSIEAERALASAS